MIKPFLTYEQQLDKLSQEKKLIITDTGIAMETLKNIGYFPVIGGYKTPFINPMTRIYEDNATFEDVLALYCFDRDLRDVFFRHLCEVELRIRQLISNCFCKRYGEHQSEYLTAANFDCSLAIPLTPCYSKYRQRIQIQRSARRQQSSFGIHGNRCLIFQYLKEQWKRVSDFEFILWEP